jgi:hypothetical protein
MPVYNPPLPMLEAASNLFNVSYTLTGSFASQTTHRLISRCGHSLRKYAESDPRIKVTTQRTQRAHLCRQQLGNRSRLGEFIAFLDNDDLLAESAFVLDCASDYRSSDVGLIYSDEDKIDELWHSLRALFQIRLESDLFLSHNMVSHLSAYPGQTREGTGRFFAKATKDRRTMTWR